MISSCSFYSIICGLLFSYLQGLIILAFAALPQLTPLFHGHLEALHFPSSYCVRSEHKGQGEDTGCAGGAATSLDVACVLVCGTTPQSPWFPSLPSREHCWSLGSDLHGCCLSLACAVLGSDFLFSQGVCEEGGGSFLNALVTWEFACAYTHICD